MIARIIQVIRRVLSPDRIRAGVRAARAGFTAFKRWYDDLPWVVKLALNPFNIYTIWEIFRDLL